MLGSGVAAGKEKSRIVVVDDDRMTRSSLRGLLEKHGHEVVEVETGQAIIELVQQKDRIDLVLLDVLMPGLSGIDCCRLIKSLTKDRYLPVVLVTARDNNSANRIEGLRTGADDYVSKPFDEHELLARVSNLLRIKGVHDEIHRAKEKLATLSVRDELTGLYNYRYLSERLAEEFERARRYQDPLACAMIDVDHFRAFNDAHGNPAGDAALIEIAERLRQSVREIDVVARYGGEEFVLILPSTHFSGALAVADRVWRAVRGAPVLIDGQALPISISIGISMFPSRDVNERDALLHAAEQALGQAKEDGRDRICVFQHQRYIYRPIPTVPPKP